MSFISEEDAKKHLDAWLEAELKVSQGQSYSIGSRTLTRASLNLIGDRIKYWRDVVQSIQAKKRGKHSRRKVVGVVPRDL